MRGTYKNYKEDNGKKLLKALMLVHRGKSIRQAADIVKMPKSTVGEEWKKFSSCGLDNVTDYVDQRSNRLVL